MWPSVQVHAMCRLDQAIVQDNLLIYASLCHESPNTVNNNLCLIKLYPYHVTCPIKLDFSHLAANSKKRRKKRKEKKARQKGGVPTYYLRGVSHMQNEKGGVTTAPSHKQV